MTQTALPQHLQKLAPVLVNDLDTRRRVPVATYRLQLNTDYTFSHAQSLVPYLHSLGITDCYASPFLHARKGSSHGYDVIDPQALNPHLGPPASFDSWADTLGQNDMGLLMDIVPNHMAILGEENAWWHDVMKHGPASSSARFFDINWHSSLSALQNKVLTPILGAAYGDVLINQDLQLVYANGQFEVGYYEHRFPIDPGTVSGILEACRFKLQRHADETPADMTELQRIAANLKSLPLRTATEPELMAYRREEAATCTQRIADLHDNWPDFRLALAAVLASYNGVKGEPQSFNPLHALLENQAYRLSHWRTASDALNYRRFFDIVHLAGVRVEDPLVFDTTHALILNLLKEGKVTGIRVDHPDGLLDPAAYFAQLQQAYVVARCRHLVSAQSATHASRLETDAERLAAHYFETYTRVPLYPTRHPLYIVVEKILEAEEALPEVWSVNGTIGYDFLNQLNGVFVDHRNAQAITDSYTDFTGDHLPFSDILYASKKLIMQSSLASEVEALVVQLARIAELDPVWRDCTRNALMSALLDIIACFPVYRTYFGRSDDTLSAIDRAVVDTAISQAQQRNPTIRPEVWAMLQSVLAFRVPPHGHDSLKEAIRHFIMSFQQVTGPVMAKGLEDTAFYRYTPLASLNEVGGDPSRFGVSVDGFHQHNLKRLQHWPTSLLATSTHDTKRSEDVRARLNALSEMPAQWHAHLWRWRDINQPHRSHLAGQSIPHPQEEYLLYQTLLGAWPLESPEQMEMAPFRQRIRDYMRKALREAKRHSTWVDPKRDYEDAVDCFIDAILNPVNSREFLADFHRFQQRIAQYGMWNSLSQTLLKITVPGIPDIYQGCELWDFSLVDPDNRRPVDYAYRQSQLEQLQQLVQGARSHRLELAQELVRCRNDGRIKLYVTWQALTFRRAHADLFLEGSYIPLEISGSRRDHLCAFARIHHDQTVIVLGPRFPTRLISETDPEPIGQAVWQDTRVILPESVTASVWSQIFTAETLRPIEVDGQTVLSVADVMASFPVAMLSPFV